MIRDKAVLIKSISGDLFLKPSNVPDGTWHGRIPILCYRSIVPRRGRNLNQTKPIPMTMNRFPLICPANQPPILFRGFSRIDAEVLGGWPSNPGRCPGLSDCAPSALGFGKISCVCSQSKTMPAPKELHFLPIQARLLSHQIR